MLVKREKVLKIKKLSPILAVTKLRYNSVIKSKVCIQNVSEECSN